MTHPGAQAESGHHPCPWCDNPVPTGAGDCPSCGQPLCPECGAKVGAYWPNCMTCGAKRELVCPKCEAPVKPRDRTCSHCGTSLERGAAAEPPPPAPAPQASPSLPPVGQSVPACSICGRQDETLRLAAFPYVFSVVFLTFRRAFAGL
jgi:hypothetical protein